MKASRVFSPLIDETDATRADGLMNSPPFSLSRSISQYICSYYPKNIFVPYPFQSYSFVMIDARFSKITLDFPRCERFKWIMLYDLFRFVYFQITRYEILILDERTIKKNRHVELILTIWKQIKRILHKILYEIWML